MKVLIENNMDFDWTKDGDILALFSRAVLVSGMHPYLAMQYVELGLGASCVFNENAKDNDSRITNPHFGCLIQEASI